MPLRQPPRDISSEVPDGFEFLNEAFPEPVPATPRVSQGSRPRLTGALPVATIAALTIVVLVIVVLVIVALRAQPDSATKIDPERGADEGSAATYSPEQSPAAEQTSTIPAQPSPSTAAQVLEQLAVKGRAPTTGYERERFGPDWADVDGNGCDTRNDILKRDLTEITTDAADTCEVESGRLVDPYSTAGIDFTRGWVTSFAVQIDHVVALSNAWQTGAQYWKPGKRLRFANDPLNLLAVDGELNMQKSDGDAATWLPPSKPYRCSYVARQIAVKAKYGLWITSPERDAMARILTTCPDQGLPS